MINDKKLTGFSFGDCLMGDFNNRLLFTLLFSENFFEGNKALMEREKVVIVLPVPPPEKTLTGAPGLVLSVLSLYVHSP